MISKNEIKKFRGLLQKKQREQTGLLLVEGVNAVEQLVKNSVFALDCLIVDQRLTSQSRILAILDLAEQAGKRVETTLRSEVDKISEDAAGVLAVAKCLVEDSVVRAGGERKWWESEKGELKTVVVCKQISDPGNAGTIIRASVALGVDHIIFTDNSVEHWNPKVVRSSVGAVFQTTVQSLSDLQKAVDYLHDLGFQIISADGYGTSENPALELGSDKVNKILSETPKLAWVFGNEAHGLSDDEIDLTDFCTKIPLSKNFESLNLAGAANICLWERKKLSK
ncbi:MAG: RNA methyltransferase [Candidatus Ancillula sp.]|jgi:TrmH family RNA methyltransferase|nr:RNA methyltransferase [Candidatus Ancillula sp.]